jgi:hypothetical protein
VGPPAPPPQRTGANADSGKLPLVQVVDELLFGVQLVAGLHERDEQAPGVEHEGPHRLDLVYVT